MKRKTAMILLIGCVLVMLRPLAARADGRWEYIVPLAGDPMEHPPYRALTLSDRKPPDLAERTDYGSEQPRYAQLTYGTVGSTRVALVVDRRSPTDVELYVDADRNRVIEPHDRVQGSGRVWQLPLDVAVAEGEKTNLTERSVVFRLSRLGHTLQYAAQGYLEGTLQLGDHTRRVRRVDGDGNGLFADTQDLIWIDSNGDGEWDPLGEQYPFVPILRLDQRYAVRGDPLGEHFSLDLLEGSGTVRIELASEELAERLIAVEVTLAGRDGSVVGLREHQKEVELPVGEYRVSTLTLSLKDPGDGRPWSYVFSEDYGSESHTWYEVAKGSCLTLDPIGRVTLETGTPDPVFCSSGAELLVQPRILVGDGLLAQSVYRGEQGSPNTSDTCQANICLLSPGGAILATSESGFS